jgi:hypothetical protein
MVLKHPVTTVTSDTVKDIKYRISIKFPSTMKGLLKLAGETPRDNVTSTAVPKICIMWVKVVPDVGTQLALTDAPMAFRQALSYVLLGDEKYAKNAISIINNWVSVCTICTGDNKQLDASWSQIMFARAIELLKFYYPGFSATGLEKRYIEWVNRVMLPVIKTPVTWTNNWTSAQCEARMQIAIVKNDTVEFNAMVAEFKRIIRILITPNGLSNEITRDYIHSCMGIGALVQIAEMAWHQGVDLYSENNYMLRNCLEKMAGLIYGQIPPELKNITIVQLRWIPYGWSIGYNHYCTRKGFAMPNVKKLIIYNPVEYSWLCWSSGTLTHRKI